MGGGNLVVGWNVRDVRRDRTALGTGGYSRSIALNKTVVKRSNICSIDSSFFRNTGKLVRHRYRSPNYSMRKLTHIQDQRGMYASDMCNILA